MDKVLLPPQFARGDHVRFASPAGTPDRVRLAGLWQLAFEHSYIPTLFRYEVGMRAAFD